MIIVVGPLPPPIHGAALVTQRAWERLVADKHSVLLCDTSPANGAGLLQYHLSRCLAYIRCCRVLLRRDRKTAGPTAVYLSISGGLGLVYDFIVVALSRFNGYDIVIHHHSFSYLTAPSLIMRAIIGVAGTNQLHIALCSLMATRLTQLYNPMLRTAVISNLAFLDSLETDKEKVSHRINFIGYLSNISFEKGIDRFFDMMAELRNKGSQLVGRIAGPLADDEIRNYVELRIEQIGGIEYVGPVFGDAKSQFLSSIDLLVFPTRYLHEAQPLVIYEAEAAGAVVSASDRGCITQMIPESLRLDSTASDLSGLIDKILVWERSPELFLPVLQEAQKRRAGLFEQQLANSERFLATFLLYK
jgi:glycosyltransferase involved in cell wall biosynthesis